MGGSPTTQAALRRVATLVARSVPQDELFGAVTDEVGMLLGADLATMVRHENDDTLTVAGQLGRRRRAHRGGPSLSARREPAGDEGREDGPTRPDGCR